MPNPFNPFQTRSALRFPLLTLPATKPGEFFIEQSAYFSRSGSACPAASESSFKDVSNGCIIV